MLKMTDEQAQQLILRFLVLALHDTRTLRRHGMLTGYTPSRKLPAQLNPSDVVNLRRFLGSRLFDDLVSRCLNKDPDVLREMLGVN